MLPALPAIGDSFAVVSSNSTQLVISIFILGTVFGELVFGPVSDAYGRRFAVISGVLLYLLGTLLTLLAPSFIWLLIGRAIQGAGVAGSRLGSRALIRDTFVGDHMARVMSFIMMVFILIPMLAPFIGQWLLQQWHWRAIFVSFMVLGLVVLTWFGLRQPETLAKEKRIPISLANMWRSSKAILRHRKVMCYTLVSGLVFGSMILYLSTAQAMFSDFYQKSDQFPMYFAILAFGIGLAAVVNGKLVLRFGMHNLSKWALQGILVFAFVLLATSHNSNGIPGFYSFMLSLALILFGVGFIFGNINAMAMQWLGGLAGIGASIVGALSSAIAVLFGVVSGHFYDGTALTLAYAYLLVAATGLCLLYIARRAPEQHL